MRHLIAITDRVRYAVPFSRLAYGVVGAELRRIFVHRHGRLLELLGGSAAEQPPDLVVTAEVANLP